MWCSTAYCTSFTSFTSLSRPSRIFLSASEIQISAGPRTYFQSLTWWTAALNLSMTLWISPSMVPNMSSRGPV
jgi:hypothetical protein